MLDVLPTAIYNDIKKHLVERAKEATESWESASDEEDTLTGELGKTFRAHWSSPVQVNGQSWSWRVDYKKFGGRGKGAFEKTSGADGIFQVEITLGEQKIFKGMLFQAKKIGSNGKLVSQIERMEHLAASSSAVFEYGPDEYRGVSGADYLKSNAVNGEKSTATYKSLGLFLADDFLPCGCGLRGIYYDAVRGLLITPGGIAYPISVKHRILLEAQAKE